MPSYTLTSTIAVHATDAVAAARQVLALHRDLNAPGPVLTVQGPNGFVSSVDLSQGKIQPPPAHDAPFNHTVTWVIDLEADGPDEAALKAYAIQRNPDSWASVFAVEGPAGRACTVDLDPEYADPSGHGTPKVVRH